MHCGGRGDVLRGGNFAAGFPGSARDRIDQFGIGDLGRCDPRDCHRAGRFHQYRKVELDRFEAMTDRSQRLASGFKRAEGFGIDIGENGFAQSCEAKFLRPRSERFNERTRRRRRPIWIADGGTRHQIEHERGVANGARDRPRHRASAPAFAAQWCISDSASRGLDPEHAAARRRNPNRSAAVAALMQRAESGRARGRGAATGASCSVFEVPGISRGRTKSALGGGTRAEFRGRGFAEQDSARAI